MLKARFDGACEPNPEGEAACSCLIERNGIEIYRESRYLGSGKGMTCNVSEFEGLMMILRWFNNLKSNEPITIIGDSRIVINRMNRRGTHHPTGVCAKIAMECVLAASWHRNLMTFCWEGRESNDECDAMCQLEIDDAVYERKKLMA